MNRFVKAEMDGSLKINVQSELFEKVKQSRAWFNNRYIGSFIMFGLAATDIAGFVQIANKTMYDAWLIRMLIVVAFTAAFELAPLYLGYAIFLKCYKLGKRIHKVVLVFSCAAFVLGIIVNGIYRYLTMDIVYGKGNINNIAIPATILLIFLPVITSLVNMVIGCLVFDPIYFDLLQLKKRISILQEKRRQLNVYIAEMNDDEKLRENLEKKIEEEYNNAEMELDKASERLKIYVDIISITHK